MLRIDTLERLRAGAGSTRFGNFLQAHLDRYPPPTREEFLALSTGEPYYTKVKGKRVPVIVGGGLTKEARRLARERARRERLTPELRAWEDSMKEAVTIAVKETYGR